VVNGDQKDLISIVLNGKSGPVEVEGVQYNGKMPAFKSILDNKKVARLLTYIRSNFGNNSSKVSETLVKQVRNGKSKKTK
jgi:mono/diheme cytochrome c family protein